MERRFESSWIQGYVVDIGPKWFLFNLVTDRIHFDGFECFRLEDIQRVRPAPYAKFVETALQKRNEERPPRPAVNLEDIDRLLLTAGRAFPLVAVHLEEVKRGACWIGKVQSIKRPNLLLLEINPDATWDEEPREHSIDDITRVNFGGEYENALYLVGGEPG